MLIWGICIR